MAITIEEVRRIAALANLEYSEQELQDFVIQFSKILEHIEQLRLVKTEGVEPTYHAVANRVDREHSRSDAVRTSFLQETALMNAPDSEDGQFRVPKVIR